MSSVSGLTWNRAREDVTSVENLDAGIRKSALEAIDVLESVLGAAFLRSPTVVQHPLVQHYIGRGHLKPVMLALLGSAVRDAQGCIAFRSAAKDIRDPELFAERVAVLRTGAGFARLGHRVAFDSAVDAKLPDIRVTPAGSTADASFLVEQSTLYPGDEMGNIFDFNHRVGRAIAGPPNRGTSHFVYLRELVTGAAADALLVELDGIAGRAHETKTLQEVSTPLAVGVIDGTGHGRALAEWLATNGLQRLLSTMSGASGTVLGPPPAVVQVYRLRRKIGREQVQFAGRPGLIVIDEQASLAALKGGLLEELSQELARHPHVLGLVHRAGIVVPGGLDSSAEGNDWALVVRRSWGSLVCEVRHAVLNPACVAAHRDAQLDVIRRWLYSSEW